MDETRAVAIVSALADGVNPLTGEIFPADSPYQAADVVRALLLAGRALETTAVGATPQATRSQEPGNLEASSDVTTRPRSRNVPPNAGKPWTEAQDSELLREFDAGRRIPDLAQVLGRTAAGIQARLEKHGRLQAQASNGTSASRRWRSPNQAMET